MRTLGKLVFLSLLGVDVAKLVASKLSFTFFSKAFVPMPFGLSSVTLLAAMVLSTPYLSSCNSGGLVLLGRLFVRLFFVLSLLLFVGTLGAPVTR